MFYYTDAVIGFEQTEVTVIEGEDAFLTTFFRSNDTSVDYHGGFFTVFSQVGKGNATGMALLAWSELFMVLKLLLGDIVTN